MRHRELKNRWVNRLSEPLNFLCVLGGLVLLNQAVIAHGFTKENSSELLEEMIAGLTSG